MRKVNVWTTVPIQLVVVQGWDQGQDKGIRLAGDPQKFAYAGGEPVPEEGRLLEVVIPVPISDSPILFAGRRKHVRVFGLP